MSDARSEVLSRIGSALGRPPAGAAADASAVVARVERRYRRAGEPAGASGRDEAAGSTLIEGPGQPPPAGLVEAFAERTADYGAAVHMATADDLAATIARCAGAERVLAAPGLDPSWLSALENVEVDSLDYRPADLDSFDTAVTACAVAIAETGTIVLDHRENQGRRALTLVPDHHICVVIESQVVAGVPEAVHALDPAGALTWVSGPSATSDIELDRVVGVHGPRRLDVIILTKTQTAAQP